MPTGGPRRCRRPARAGRSAILPLLILSMACGKVDPADRAVVRDSAGITIIENPSPDDSTANDWWRIGQPVVDIGSADAAAEYALYRVNDAIRLSDGRIIVANGGSSDIRFFDADGQYLLKAGGEGGGPGEFRALTSLDRGAADSVIAFDQGQRRVSIFSPDGMFVRDFQFGTISDGSRPVGRFDDGSWLATVGIRIGDGDLALLNDQITRADALLLHNAPDGSTIDTLGSFPGSERMIHIGMTNGVLASVEISQPAFARSTSFAVGPAGFLAGTQDTSDIRGYSLDGALRSIIRTGRTVKPVTEQHLEAMWQRRLENMPEERQDQIRARGRESMSHGNVVPPYGAFVTDSEGNLWVSDYDDAISAAGRWTVYAADGTARARIALPARFQPFEIGTDWILGREYDELDVEHVRIYPIQRN